jgi:hypothetical protein
VLHDRSSTRDIHFFPILGDGLAGASITAIGGRTPTIGDGNFLEVHGTLHPSASSVAWRQRTIVQTSDQ